MQTAFQTIIQESIVLLLVGWSVWQLLRRFAARPLYLLQSRIAALLQRHGWPRMAAYLTPVTPTTAGCSQGCGGCSSNAAPSCASQAATPADTAVTDLAPSDVRPVQWR